MNFAEYIENPENIKMLKKLFYISLVAVVLADLLVHREHVELVWEGIPGFGAVFGFISCLLLIVGKFLGHELLMKEEDYYDR